MEATAKKLDVKPTVATTYSQTRFASSAYVQWQRLVKSFKLFAISIINASTNLAEESSPLRYQVLGQVKMIKFPDLAHCFKRVQYYSRKIFLLLHSTEILIVDFKFIIGKVIEKQWVWNKSRWNKLEFFYSDTCDILFPLGLYHRPASDAWCLQTISWSHDKAGGCICATMESMPLCTESDRLVGECI